MVFSRESPVNRGLYGVEKNSRSRRKNWLPLARCYRGKVRLGSVGYNFGCGDAVKPLLRVLILIATLGCLSLGDRVQADWMSLTGAETAPNIAEIYIEDDQVRLVLEIYIDDLDTFQDLIPDGWLEDLDLARPGLQDRLRRFSSDKFRVVTGDGKMLSADLILAEPRLRKDRFSPFAGMINPTTGQKIPEAPADKRVLYVELSYPFDGHPESLTIIPPLDEDGVPEVNIGFIAYQKAVPIIDFRYLTAPVSVNLDWDDPWYSQFDNPTLKRHHKSALMSFLYVEPDEVRHEVLTRVKDLETWMDLDLADDNSIAPEEWDRIMDRVGDFLITKNPVRIDGTIVPPTITRANFVAIGLNGIQVLEQPQTLDVSTAILGFILSYESDGLPQEVTVEWELFTDQIKRVPATTTDPAGPFISYAEPNDRVIRWQNHLKTIQDVKVEAIQVDPDFYLRLPVLSLCLLVLAIGAACLAISPRVLPRRAWIIIAFVGLVASGLLSSVAVVKMNHPFAKPPSTEMATEIATQLTSNLHTALDQRDESKGQKFLAESISVDKQGEVLPEARRALVVHIKGGGRARVDSVDGLVAKEITPLDGGGFRALVEWSADASAGHWGHIHNRRIRFNALMDIAPVAGAWMLVGLTVLNAEQES